MSENTKIQWCDHTFNPWEGCSKVSPGCLHCYAEARNNRFGGGNWGKGRPRRRTSVANWKLPLKWNKRAAIAIDGWNTFREMNKTTDAELIARGHIKPPRPRVFCASLADWLDEEVPIEWLADLLKLIHDTPNLDWLLLTKRPQNFSDRIERSLITANGGDASDKDWFAKHGDTFPANEYAGWLNEWTGGVPPHNVWLGTSVEDQQRAAERIPALLKIPAKIRFLSVEPMLERIDFGKVEAWLTSDTGSLPDGAKPRLDIDWAIFGGESGPGARTCYVNWIQDGLAQCHDAGVKAFVKQMGSNVAGHSEITDKWVCRIKDKKGGDMSEWPADMRVREFPV